MGDRCTGHCCQSFFLPNPPSYYATAAKNWKPPFLIDAEKISSMIVLVAIDIKRYVIPVEPGEGPQWGADGYRYDCKHFDAESGNCTDYENRPRMCVEYPYGRACANPECTWDDAREGRVPHEEAFVVDKSTQERLHAYAERTATLKPPDDGRRRLPLVP
jgi:Fe-S-cluster containining protein